MNWSWLLLFFNTIEIVNDYHNTYQRKSYCNVFGLGV